MSNLYRDLKNRQQKEFDEFPKFFAFDDKQFEEGLNKLGYTLQDMEDGKVKIVHIGAGCYMTKDDVERFENLSTAHQEEMKAEIEKDTTGEGFIKDMFEDELVNHEYGYTGELEDTLDALDLSYEDLEKPNIAHGLELAKEIFKEKEEEGLFGDNAEIRKAKRDSIAKGLYSESNDLSKDLYGDEAEKRNNERKESIRKNLDLAKHLLNGETILDPVDKSELDLDTVKVWLKNDYVRLNNLLSADPDEVNKKLAQEFPDIFGDNKIEESIENDDFEGINNFEKLFEKLEQLLEEGKIDDDQYEDARIIAEDEQEACEDYIERRSEVTNTDWDDEIAFEEDYTKSAIDKIKEMLNGKIEESIEIEENEFEVNKCTKCGSENIEFGEAESEMIYDNEDPNQYSEITKTPWTCKDCGHNGIQIITPPVLEESKLQEANEDDGIDEATEQDIEELEVAEPEVEEDPFKDEEGNEKSLFDLLQDRIGQEMSVGEFNTVLQALFSKFNEVFLLTSDLYNMDPSERQELTIFDDDDMYTITYEIKDVDDAIIEITDVNIE